MRKRLVSEHFKRDGRPKKPLSRSQAKDAAARQHMNAYRCKFCGHWHIGGHR